jgi:hypothetical protein
VLIKGLVAEGERSGLKPPEGAATVSGDRSSAAAFGRSGAVVESDLVAVGVGEGERPTKGPSIGAETMV